MKRVFVTGGSGFVGKRLIAALRERGCEVVAMARSDGAAAVVAGLGATPARCDLGDTVGIAKGMAGCDTVFHAAAHVEQHGPLEAFLQMNVIGTKNVIAAARTAGVATLVHVSTEAVLADGKPIVQADETVPITRKPAGPYPATKGMAEHLVVRANDDKLRTTVIRPRFIWGIGDTSLLPEIIDAVKRGKFGWFSGGRYLTSTCNIANVIEGALCAADRGGGGEVYFLTDGAPVEFRDFMTKMLATQGVDASKVRNVPVWVARTVAFLTSWMKTPPVTKTAIALVGHEVTVIDAKARREIGYAGKMSIEDGLAEMAAAAR